MMGNYSERVMKSVLLKLSQHRLNLNLTFNSNRRRERVLQGNFFGDALLNNNINIGHEIWNLHNMPFSQSSFEISLKLFV